MLLKLFWKNVKKKGNASMTHYTLFRIHQERIYGVLYMRCLMALTLWTATIGLLSLMETKEAL